MTTRQEILNLVIEPLRLLGKPNVDPINSPMEFARMVDMYVETLKGFDSATVKQAMLIFQRDWQTKAWPMPGKLHQFCVDAEAEHREPGRPSRPQIEERHISKEERERVAPRLGRLKNLLKSGELGKMTREEAYNVVYLEEPWPGHKQDRLANIGMTTGQHE